MEHQLESMTKVLLSNGFRLTDARQAILDTLLSCNGHLSADELVARVRRRAPKVGRMTVYRTLDLLTDLNLIRPVYQGTAAAHYILMEEGRHHHLVCSHCNNVIEIDDCSLQELEEVITNQYSFRIEGHLLEVYGRCESCHDQ